MHYAALLGRDAIVASLLRAGADPLVTSKNPLIVEENSLSDIYRRVSAQIKIHTHTHIYNIYINLI